MYRLSNRMKLLLSTALAAGLVASSVTACSPRGRGETPDSKTQSQQHLQPGSGTGEGEDGNDTEVKDDKSNEQIPASQSSVEKIDNTPEVGESKVGDHSTKGQKSDPERTVEEVTPENSEGYMTKYIEPYYVTGLMYTTWTSVAEIGVERLIHFYEYNALGDYCTQLERENPDEFINASQWSVPAEIVEFFITYYFKVDSQYLHQAENYDATTNTYNFAKEFGIGGGPGVVIKEIEKDESGNIWTFICSDINGQEASVTVEVVNQDQFYYISGKGI